MVGTVDRAASRGHLAAAVRVERDVIGEDREKCRQIAARACIQELMREALVLLPNGGETRPRRVQVLPGALRDLPAVGAALADDARDLIEGIAEDLVEKEDGAFHRAEVFQEREERQRQRL